MKKAQGLKTLGDYRRAAKDSLFSICLPPENNRTSDYDAIKTALEHFKTIIRFSRSNFSERDWWKGRCSPGTKYEMINPTLFDCIKLMEFAKKYHEKSIYELYSDWPKHPEPNANFFSIFGYSYLEVGFKMVCKQGREVIDILQNSYLENKKGGKRPYVRLDPFIFLNKTPEVDDLEINPEPDNELDSKPDIIIKTWFDNMMKGMKSEFSISGYSRQKVETEFNSIQKQLEHELKNPKEPARAQSNAGKKEPVSKIARLILEKLKSLQEHEAMDTVELLTWLSREHKKDIDDSTLRRYLNELKPYGLRNKPKIGYFLS